MDMFNKVLIVMDIIAVAWVVLMRIINVFLNHAETTLNYPLRALTAFAIIAVALITPALCIHWIWG